MGKHQCLNPIPLFKQVKEEQKGFTQVFLLLGRKMFDVFKVLEGERSL